MSNVWHVAILATMSSLLLTACDNDSQGRTVGQQLDSAISRTEKAGGQTLATVRELADDAREKVNSAKVQETLKAAGQKISTNAEDIAITGKIRSNFIQDPELSSSQLDVETSNGVVTLRGNAPSAAAIAKAERIANSVSNVSKVNNEIVVGRGNS
jgi:hyperosmotically inducible protein